MYSTDNTDYATGRHPHPGQMHTLLHRTVIGRGQGEGPPRDVGAVYVGQPCPAPKAPRPRDRHPQQAGRKAVPKSMGEKAILSPSSRERSNAIPHQSCDLRMYPLGSLSAIRLHIVGMSSACRRHWFPIECMGPSSYKAIDTWRSG
ncbi:hypothetical protein BO71DRAFT_125268 [Aspergillus ellipticus CBS 707.79]|uniref:Uncharacterized protein n=1 Tax=Aspergillus ellipticus CBS 707.79 TaxID=1448320 RepID=A0A319CVI2_9EURO|nr:hypothetical protein BO71DRAFT_125268 [Aspergillus ellipticus CBS 707.79]